MTNLDYGFDTEPIVDPELDEQEDRIRPNYRITQSCGNCKFFWYDAAKQRRGFCKLPNPQEKVPNTHNGESYDKEEIYRSWNRTHSSCLCDNHIMKPKAYSIGKIAEWTNKKFNTDGSLKDVD